MKIKVDNKFIGEKNQCFIIAEAGINHDGDFNKAIRLIDIAKAANADAVKFQTWKTEEIITKTVNQTAYQERNIGKKDSQFNMLKRLELTFEAFKDLKNYAKKKGIIFLSTPDDEKSADFLDSIGVPAFKIGSGELTNIFMLERIAEKNKPIILSTGMANLKEIEEAVKTIYSTGNKKLILLHCTSQYPTEFKDVNLRAMLTLKKKFNTIIGYSDHTIGTLVPQIAVSMGAKVIEKHFTYDTNAIGPDHKCSLNPIDLKKMVRKIRFVELILGNESKNPTKEEQKIKRLIRKMVVAKINIPKGTEVTKEMLTVKRSDGIIEPKDLNKLIGQISKINIEKDKSLKFEYFNDIHRK